MGPSPHLWILQIHNSAIMTRINYLHGSQTSPVALCMQNNVISFRITSLYWAQPSFVVFACTTAALGPELQVRKGPRSHLWFGVYKTATLTPELQTSIGPSPHRWFCAFTTATL